jgi:hypothetical protein
MQENGIEGLKRERQELDYRCGVEQWFSSLVSYARSVKGSNPSRSKVHYVASCGEAWIEIKLVTDVKIFDGE